MTKNIIIGIIILSVCGLMFSGCKTSDGVAAGTLIGGIAGAVIGHQSGEKGEGAAIGAAIGAVAGGLAANATQTRFCPNCGREYAKETSYCIKCGKTLKVKGVKSNVLKCSKCNKAYNTEYKFCPQDGGRIERETY
jgi:uncharacterized protein YcfJ